MTHVQGMSLKEAARKLRIDVSTLRRDIATGCPVLELGSVGRGKGARVDLDAVRRWRASKRGDALALFEAAMEKFLLSGLLDVPGLRPAQAVVVVVRMYRALYEYVTGMEVTKHTMPAQMKRLCAIGIQYSDRDVMEIWSEENEIGAYDES